MRMQSGRSWLREGPPTRVARVLWRRATQTLGVSVETDGGGDGDSERCYLHRALGCVRAHPPLAAFRRANVSRSDTAGESMTGRATPYCEAA